MAKERGRSQGLAGGAGDPGDAVPPGGAGGEAEAGAGRPRGERDPGDAVPPGVAPEFPLEPTADDLRALEKLRDLPRRED